MEGEKANQFVENIFKIEEYFSIEDYGNLLTVKTCLQTQKLMDFFIKNKMNLFILLLFFLNSIFKIIFNFNIFSM